MSTLRHCSLYKAKDQKWYMELAEEEYGEYEDSDCFGPFDSEEECLDYLNNFSNPGGYDIDDSGRMQPPTKSPNGSKVQRPMRRGW